MVRRVEAGSYKLRMLVAITLIGIRPLLCQTHEPSISPDIQPVPKPEFAVASVRQNTSGIRFVKMEYTADGFTATNMPLHYVITSAFDLQDPTLMGSSVPGIPVRTIPGEPKWTLTDGYDIRAKVSPAVFVHLRGLTDEQRVHEQRLMLQALLIERFHLTFHIENSTARGFALVIAKNGPRNMKRVLDDGETRWNFDDPAHLVFKAYSMADLAGQLTIRMDQIVLDKTGLVGKFDFELDGLPDPSKMHVDNATGPERPGPYFREAIQEQLGLRLESTNIPVQRLIIDHIERPSEN